MFVPRQVACNTQSEWEEEKKRVVTLVWQPSLGRQCKSCLHDFTHGHPAFFLSLVYLSTPFHCLLSVVSLGFFPSPTVAVKALSTPLHCLLSVCVVGGVCADVLMA